MGLSTHISNRGGEASWSYGHGGDPEADGPRQMKRVSSRDGGFMTSKESSKSESLQGIMDVLEQTKLGREGRAGRKAR